MLGTKDELMVAATGLLDEGGPAAVTMRDVGARAHLSHNAPYKHFADKEHLLAAVAASELRTTSQLLRERRADLRAAMGAVLSRSLRYPHRFRLVYGHWAVMPDELAEAATDAWDALLDVVAATVERGALPPGDVARTANLLRAVAHGAIELEIGGHLTKGGTSVAPADLLDDLLERLAP